MAMQLHPQPPSANNSPAIKKVTMQERQFHLEQLDRLPPADDRAEKAVIGCCLLDSDRIDDVAAILHQSDFRQEACGCLFGHLLDMRNQRIGIDATTLLSHLTHAGDLERIGGDAFIAECAQAEWSAQFAKHHAENVLRSSQLRQIIHACTSALPIAYSGQSEPSAVLSTLESHLLKIVTSEYSRGPRSIADAVVEFNDRIDAIVERGHHAGVMTGIIDFDETTGGLFAGELDILAARTGNGKTSLACQIAEYVANRGRTVYFASLEMSDVELVQRMACGRAGVSSKRIRNGSLSPDDRKRLAVASSEIFRLSIVIDDRAGMTADDICRSARQQKMKHPDLSLVVVDYLQRITPRDLKQQRHLQIGEMTDALKRLARELEVPVLCLAQLSREAEKEECPSLRHLRESGSIEQDADMVIFINRKNAEANEESDIKTELVIAKNRNGETGSINLEWHGSRTRFEAEGYSRPAGREVGFDQYDGR